MPARVALLCLLVATGAGAGAQSPEEFARRQYDSGLSFLQNARYAEALKDFQIVVDSFPQSAVADDALMQVALYHLDVAHDQVAAQAAADRLLKDYPNSDSAPMAYIIGGRITMAKGRSTSNVEAALAAFERVPRLFPGSEAVAAARYYAGDTLRMARRADEAFERLRRVAMEYPRSIWSARADLATAAALVSQDRAREAFARLQRIRQQFPGTPEADAALQYNTILYRLYVRAPAQPPYAFSGRFIGSEGARYGDVMGLAVDDAGRVVLGHGQGATIFDEQGSVQRAVAAQDPSAFFVEQRTRVVIVRRDTLIPEGSQPIFVSVPQPGRLPRPVEEIPAVIALSNGDRLIADRSTKAVIRYSSQGKYIGSFVTMINTERFARNELDDVAMYDRDSRTVVITDRDGKPLGRIALKGANYQINDVRDLAFDALGHLFVLDRAKPTIHVFGPRNRLLTTISAGLQRPRAIALDRNGRLLVFDESARRIQVHQ
jgi:outer membrane protein assembly factor BamD (BamD/ComL family)